MLKVDLKNSTAYYPPPILFFLCSLAQGKSPPKSPLKVYLPMQPLEPRLHPWYSLFLHNSSSEPLHFTCQMSLKVFLLLYVSTASYHLLLFGYQLPNWSSSSRLVFLPSSKFLFYPLLFLLTTLDLSVNLSFCPHTCIFLSIMKCCFSKMWKPSTLRMKVVRLNFPRE